MSESGLEPQSLGESETQTADPSSDESAIMETAVGSNVIIHSTPIATQLQLNESAVDSGIQLTPVLTNKNKQSDDMDIMSFLQKIDSKFESRFNSNDDLLRKMYNDINEQKIKCEQQNLSLIHI